MADVVLTAAPTEAAPTVVDHMAVATSTAAEVGTAPMGAVDSTDAILTAVAISTPVAVDMAHEVVAVSEAAEIPNSEILGARCQLAIRRKMLARAQLRPTSIIRRLAIHLGSSNRTTLAPIIPAGARLEIDPILPP